MRRWQVQCTAADISSRLGIWATERVGGSVTALSDDYVRQPPYSPQEPHCAGQGPTSDILNVRTWDTIGQVGENLPHNPLVAP